MTDRNERRPGSADKTVRDIRGATRRKFFAFIPSFPGLRVCSKELLQGIDVHLQDGRRFLQRAHLVCQCPKGSEGLLGLQELRPPWLFGKRQAAL